MSDIIEYRVCGPFVPYFCFVGEVIVGEWSHDDLVGIAKDHNCIIVYVVTNLCLLRSVSQGVFHPMMRGERFVEVMKSWISRFLLVDIGVVRRYVQVKLR